MRLGFCRYNLHCKETQNILVTLSGLHTFCFPAHWPVHVARFAKETEYVCKWALSNHHRPPCLLVQPEKSSLQATLLTFIVGHFECVPPWAERDACFILWWGVTHNALHHLPDVLQVFDLKAFLSGLCLISLSCLAFLYEQMVQNMGSWASLELNWLGL